MEAYKTIRRRFLAAVLDSIILAPVSILVTFFFGILDASPAISTAAVGIISVSYYIGLHAYYGQTVGKKAASVKVLDDSEKRINFGQAVLRSLPQLIVAMFALSFSNSERSASTETVASILNWFFGIFVIADIVVCLVNEKHRALHDFIAGTIVVRTDV